LKRTVISIDREACTGCGACADACHQGAIQMVDGKAKLMSEDHCDGLGRCLPHCPVDAITMVEKEVNKAFTPSIKAKKAKQESQTACGCPSTVAKTFEKNDDDTFDGKVPSQLNQWPCQIQLVNPVAPFFDGADLLIAADCCSFSYGDFHRDFMKGKITLIGCPKLDPVDYSDKLADILENNDIKSLTVTRMSVPCCGGLTHAVMQAVQKSGKDIPLNIVVISTEGEVIDNKAV
jgi:ferredoxin